MKKKIRKLMFAFLLVNVTSFAQNVSNFGSIPISRIATSGWENFKFDDSGSWEVIDVTTKGIVPNSSEDIAPRMQELIKMGSGKRIFKFPAGSYQLKTPLIIGQDDVQIIGVGNATRFYLAGGDSDGHFSVNGKRNGSFKLSKDGLRGDTKIVLISSIELTVGDYIYIEQKGGERESDMETQIVKITAISGNEVTFDIGLGIPFYVEKARIQKMDFVKNIKFSNFYLERLADTKDKSVNITLSQCRNVEVSNVESNKARTSHFNVFRSTDVIFFKNKMYGNFGGSGGFQYGITANYSTKVHMIYNETSDLRHHFATQFGTNHCVIAYNKALPPYNHYADYGQHNSKGCHNNLFEGNYGKELFDDLKLKSWGTRHTMWFRNRAMSKVGSEATQVESQTIIGNEIEATAANGIKRGPENKNPFVAANIVLAKEGSSEKTIEWGDLKKGDAIPASLFLKKKPSYLEKWPLYGPKVK